MDTKLKSDIAESAAVTALLKNGFNVLKPVGDRLPFDIAVEVNDKLIKLQVKSAWSRKTIFIVDSRRTKTNRKKMVRKRYAKSDFDFALIYIDKKDLFFIMPINVFNSYKSEITLSLSKKDLKSSKYLERWDVISKG